MARIAFGTLILAFWLLMVGLLAWRHLLPARMTGGDHLDVAVLTDDWQDVEEWMLVSFGEKKAGVFQSEVRRQTPGYVTISRANLSLANPLAPKVRFQSIARLDDEFHLESFWLTAAAPPVALDVRGLVWESKLLLEFSATPGQTRHGFYPLEQPIALMDSLRPLASQKIDLSPGAVYRFSAFDPLWSGLAGEATLKVVGPERIEIDGEGVSATKLETTLAGQKILAWVDEHKNVIRYQFMNNVKFDKIRRERALAMEPSFAQDPVMPQFNIETFASSHEEMDLSQQSPLSMVSQLFLGVAPPNHDSN